MELDRSTRKELARLAHEAQDLWEEQRDVLSRAKRVARHASTSAKSIRVLVPVACWPNHPSLVYRDRYLRGVIG